MPSSITSILDNPYLSSYLAFPTAVNTNTNVATLANHPFNTGDALWTQPYTLVSSVLRYAIRVDANSLAIATSAANAASDVRVAFPTNTIGSTVNGGGLVVANTPILTFFGGGFVYGSSPTLKSWMNASSISLQSFSVTDNVQIDFTSPALFPENSFTNIVNIRYIAGLSSAVGGYENWILDASPLWTGDSITGFNWTYKDSRTNTWRILIQNQRVTVQNLGTNGSYLTLFTSSILSINIQQLRFFFLSGINGLSLTNCRITYL